MKRTTLGQLIFGVALLVSSNAFAADVRIIHGIDGRDLKQARRLPVDISVNGTCLLKGVTFKRTAQVELEAGSYDVKVFAASGSCSGSPVIEETVEISPENAKYSFSLVASLNSSGTPQLAVFQNSGNRWGAPGVTIRHVAKAGAVTTRTATREFGTTTPPFVDAITNGQEATRLVFGSRFQFRASIDSGRKRPVVVLTGKVNKALRVFYVVGSAANGFSIISETIKD
jgi:hypothetical protein